MDVNKIMEVKNNRKIQRLFRYAVDTFVELICQVTKRKRLDYRCNDADTASWRYFMEAFPTVGEDFIRKFAEYGIQSWFNDGNERDYSRAVRFNWIFGRAAIDRWNKNSMKTNVYLTRIGLKKENKINVVRIKSCIPELIVSIRPVEENFKAEFHNTKRGLAWCIANTTLYFHKSSNCVKCVFKKECKDILKREYPKVYKKRGYDNQSEE
nr:MAG TPA: hypothetical protein [Caudoviricetes sp.]